MSAAEKRINKSRLSGRARIDNRISTAKIIVLFLNNMKRAVSTSIAESELGLASAAAFNRKGLSEIRNEIKNARRIFFNIALTHINKNIEIIKQENEEIITGALTISNPVLYKT